MKRSPANLPITLLYNLDNSWSSSEKNENINLVDWLKNCLSTIGHPTTSICLDNKELKETMAGLDPEGQIIFNWCEEIPGIQRSSAMVASVLEEMGFSYTGADSRSLQLSYDKPAIKRRLQELGIPTPGWQVFLQAENLDWNCFPAIVKPAYEHSSVGITHEAVVNNSVELSKRVAQVLELFHEPVLVEDFIEGREFHVTVVGNGRLRVFPIAEMDFSAIGENRDRLCTYDSKFNPSSSDYLMIQLRLPAVLSDEEKQQLEKVAIAAYRAGECRDYARLDIRQRDGSFYVLDINPNADISPDTSIALSAELAGYPFGEFVSMIVGLAAHRHPIFGRRERKTVTQISPAISPVIG